MENGRVFVTAEQGATALPDGDNIHTFRNSGPALLGCDMSRADIQAAMEEAENIELAGESAKGMGHGIAVIPKGCKWLSEVLFVETDADRLAALESAVASGGAANE